MIEADYEGANSDIQKWLRTFPDVDPSKADRLRVPKSLRTMLYNSGLRYGIVIYSYGYEQTIIDNTLLPDAQRLLSQAQNQLASTPEDQPGYAGLYQAITQLAGLISSHPSSSALAAALANLTPAMANARGSW